MPGKRRQFSREFKEEAVRLWAESGRPLAQIARELTIRAEQLRRWRPAARDYRRFMTEKEIMDLCGWKTHSTFERYDIIRPEDVDAGLARRFNGKQTANIEPAGEPAE